MSSTAKPLTGGSSDYYKVTVNGVTIECNDIIKALRLNYALGNILKAVWRIGMAHLGNGKPGTTTVYDAEKIVFFGNDQLEVERETESNRPKPWQHFVPTTGIATQGGDIR